MAYATKGQVQNYAQVNKVDVGKESYKLFGFSTQALFDTWVESLITWADKAIDNYVEHDFARHPSTASTEAAETGDGDGTDIILPHYPIISLSQIRYRSGLTDGTWAVVPSTDYKVYERFIRLNRQTPVGFLNVELTYAYGYVTVPDIVSLASVRICTNIIQFALQRATSPIVRIDNFTVEQAKEEAFTDDIKESLSPYRRIPFAVTQA